MPAPRSHVDRTLSAVLLAVAVTGGCLVGVSAVSAEDTAGSIALLTTSGVEITEGTAVQAADLSTLTIDVAGTAASSAKLVLDGVYLGADTTPPFSFDLPPLTDGTHKVRWTVVHDNGDSAKETVRFTVVDQQGPTTTTPSSVPTAPSSPPVTGPSTTPPSPTPPSSTPPTVTAPSTTPPPPGEVVVHDARSLQAALAAARPGTTITLRDGNYRGKEVRDPSGNEPGRFVARGSGTALAPIVLRGSRNAVLDGGGTGGGYAVHLVDAEHWILQGFSVRSASKGIVLDRSSHNRIEDVHVTDIGAEGVHFRAFSSDNVITRSVVDHTGMTSPNFGEGVYIGSARSNWGQHSGGLPDRSDRNQVIDNVIVDTAAENIDVKEGSANGVLRGNRLGGDRIASKNSADSWIDVKGNGYLVEDNHGSTAPKPGTQECGDPKGDPASPKNPFCDGFQVHVILAGWGRDNVFRGNVLEVNAPGVGIWLQNTAVGAGNVIHCDNTVTGAAAGSYATNHYSALPCSP